MRTDITGTILSLLFELMKAFLLLLGQRMAESVRKDRNSDVKTAAGIPDHDADIRIGPGDATRETTLTTRGLPAPASLYSGGW